MGLDQPTGGLKSRGRGRTPPLDCDRETKPVLPSDLQTQDCVRPRLLPEFPACPRACGGERVTSFRSLSRLFLWRALTDTVPTGCPPGSRSIVLRAPPRADRVGAEFGGRKVKLGERSPWPVQGSKCWPRPLYFPLSERHQAHSAKEDVPGKGQMVRNLHVSSFSR